MMPLADILFDLSADRQSDRQAGTNASVELLVRVGKICSRPIWSYFVADAEEDRRENTARPFQLISSVNKA